LLGALAKQAFVQPMKNVQYLPERAAVEIPNLLAPQCLASVSMLELSCRPPAGQRLFFPRKTIPVQANRLGLPA